MLLAASRQHDVIEPLRPGGVIAVTVGEQDQADPTSLLSRSPNRLEMPGIIGPGIDHHTRI